MTETLTSKTIAINQNIQLFIQQQEAIFNQKELGNAWIGEQFLADLLGVNVGFHSTALWFTMMLLTLMFAIWCITLIDKNNKLMKLYEKSISALLLISSIVVPTYFAIKFPQDIQKYREIAKTTNYYVIAQLQELLNSGEITQSEYNSLLICRSQIKIDINCVQKSTINNKDI